MQRQNKIRMVSVGLTMPVLFLFYRALCRYMGLSEFIQNDLIFMVGTALVFSGFVTMIYLAIEALVHYVVQP